MDLPSYEIQIDALYFQTRDCSLAYALKEGKSLSPEPRYRLGFRVKGAKGLCHDDWKVSLSFLHYHARTTRESSEGIFVPAWGHPDCYTGETSTSVRSRWRLHLGYLDLGLERSITSSCFLDLIPKVGLRFAGVRHKARLDYRGTSFGGSEEDLSMKNKFWGLGPRFGLELLWRLCRPLHLYLSGCYSLLYGEFYIHQDEEDTEKLKIKSEWWDIQGGLDGGMGLEWKPHACLSARLGWEGHLIDHQNLLYRFPSREMPGKFTQERGNLAFYGLRAGLAFYF